VRSWSIRGRGGRLRGVEGSLPFFGVWFVYVFWVFGMGMGCPFLRGGFVLFSSVWWIGSPLPCGVILRECCKGRLEGRAVCVRGETLEVEICLVRSESPATGIGFVYNMKKGVRA
jgi:hypothetical protein